MKNHYTVEKNSSKGWIVKGPNNETVMFFGDDRTEASLLAEQLNEAYEMGYAFGKGEK